MNVHYNYSDMEIYMKGKKGGEVCGWGGGGWSETVGEAEPLRELAISTTTLASSLRVIRLVYPTM